MKNEKYVLYGVLILVVIVLAFSLSGYAPGINSGSGDRQLPPTSQIIDSASDAVVTGTTGAGDVEIELIPHEVENEVLEVDISANTHSVDLSQFDLLKITTLEFDGKAIAPDSAPKLGGHHASGTLTFKVNKPIQDFKITIREIPKIKDRVFEWGLNQG
ncbi:hypothetical protein GOV09_02670 [Candidatus Woesearchaeota archaeon]|nr:hypothetical protein [Candidatus Woesearchaeota archaeon]